MRRTVSVILLIILASLVAGCTGTEQIPQSQTTTIPTTVANTPVPTTTSPPATPISQAQEGVSANTITISDFAFNPQTIIVKAGAIVRWDNQDTVSHRVVFTDPTGNIIKYDSSVLSPGQSWSQRFTTAGTFTYYCKIHPAMTGTVVVE